MSTKQRPATFLVKCYAVFLNKVFSPLIFFGSQHYSLLLHISVSELLRSFLQPTRFRHSESLSNLHTDFISSTACMEDKINFGKSHLGGLLKRNATGAPRFSYFILLLLLLPIFIFIRICAVPFNRYVIYPTTRLLTALQFVFTQLYTAGTVEKSAVSGGAATLATNDGENEKDSYMPAPSAWMVLLSIFIFGWILSVLYFFIPKIGAGLYFFVITGSTTVIPNVVPAAMLTFALLVPILAHPIHSLMALFGVFLLAVLLFLLNGAEYLGLVFLIVYVGALAILFLFVILLMNLSARKVTLSTILADDSVKIASLTGTILFTVSSLHIFSSMILDALKPVTYFTFYTNRTTATDEVLSYINMRLNDIFALRSLFESDFAGFLQITAILLFALVGALVLARLSSTAKNHVK
jgi:NADH:ubiquinone oxidoreductase subunit 6 (subunit J)